MRKVLALLLLIHAAPTLAGWTSGVNPEHAVSPGATWISYSPHQDEGAPTFKDALDALARTGNVHRLDVIDLHWLVEDASFQKELIVALQASAPSELAQAMRSSGNTHNPKVVQLRRPFEASVLSTPTVTKIISDLSHYGLDVFGASSEKLTIFRSNGQPKLMCFLWLSVSQQAVLRPNNSFKPTPHRGVGHVPTLR
jgi:hypothetical protein